MSDHPTDDGDDGDEALTFAVLTDDVDEDEALVPGPAIPREHAAAFWRGVRERLKRRHEVPPEVAQRGIDEYRACVENPEVGAAVYNCGENRAADAIAALVKGWKKG